MTLTTRYDNDGGDDDDSALLPYVCVHCGTPSAALYRQLSASLSSIKAVACTVCHQRQVDPYMEREWLLVVIDAMLLRPEAYRHILFNVVVIDNVVGEEAERGGGRKKTVVTSSSKTLIPPQARTLSRRQALQLVVVSCLLQACLKWETLVRWRDDHPHQSDENLLYDRFLEDMTRNDTTTTTTHNILPTKNVILFFPLFLVITSLLEATLQWLAVFTCLRLQQCSNKSTHHHAKKRLAVQVFWALLLPMAFHIVTVMVLVWENSSMTRGLASVLVSSWQILGTWLLWQRRPKKDEKWATTSILGAPYVASMVGMMVLSLVRYTVSSVLPSYPNPCIGLRLDHVLSATTIAVEGNVLPLCLC